MLQAFPFEFFFGFFILIFVVAFIMVIVNFIRSLRGSPSTQSTEEGTPVVKEREIIREIVKIRCPYCNNLYDEKYDRCPYCGRKRN